MEIPSFYVFMLPILQILADGKEHTQKEVRDILIKQFKFDEEALNQTIPSGKQTTFHNRVYWALSYIKKATLISSHNRGIFKITAQGKKVLATNPQKIDAKFLRQFDEFNAFQHRGKNEKDKIQSGADEIAQSQTPEEQIENAYKLIKSTLADKLLNKIREVEPSFFEKLVVELLVKMGYGGSQKDIREAFNKGQAEVTGKSGDEGIDGIIKEDKLGLDVIYIQAKRYKDGSTISRKEIQSFAGALDGKGAKKGVFITTSDFSKEARNYAKDIKSDKKIIVIDGNMLAELMIGHDLGVKLEYKYELKKLDGDYFEEDFE